LKKVWEDLQAGTKAALKVELGADWEQRTDISATFEALPLMVEKYVPDTDAMVSANLNPEQIAELTAEAAYAAPEELFLKGSIGDQMLRRVVIEAYKAALTNKDFALTLLIRGQAEILERQDLHDVKLESILAALPPNRRNPPNSDELGSGVLAPRPRFFGVPTRIPHFVGRTEELTRLHTILVSGEQAAGTQAISSDVTRLRRCALYGLGGAGKTVLAA
jgi:hypothetical protein